MRLEANGAHVTVERGTAILVLGPEDDTGVVGLLAGVDLDARDVLLEQPPERVLLRVPVDSVRVVSVFDEPAEPRYEAIGGLVGVLAIPAASIAAMFADPDRTLIYLVATLPGLWLGGYVGGKIGRSLAPEQGRTIYLVVPPGYVADPPGWRIDMAQ